MKSWRLPVGVLLVLVGLGLGATLLRDQVPLGGAVTPSASTPGPTPSTPSAANTEAAARLQNEQNTMDIVDRYEPGLVFITTEQQVTTQDPLAWMYGESSQVQRGVGSGFFVNTAGDILTNFHVVAGENGDISTSKLTVRVMGSSTAVPAKIIGVAPQYDLALIRPSLGEGGLPAGKIKPIPLGNSDTLKAGQKTIAMGAPFGLDFSVSEGIVSSVSRQIPIGFGLSGSGITQKAIQTDAAINPGNSGGPLLDSGGQVIGINTQIFSPSGQTGAAQSAGIGFAIPINVAKNLLPRLQQAAGGVVLAPRLGIEAGLWAGRQGGALPVGLSALTSEARQAWSLPDTGLLVAKVSPQMPAAKAGVRGGNQTEQFRGGEITLGGDVITAVDSKPIDGIEDLQAALIDKKAGDSVTLSVVRGGKTQEIKVPLDASAFAP